MNCMPNTPFFIGPKGGGSRSNRTDAPVIPLMVLNVSPPPAAPRAAPTAGAVRMFGRYQLLRLLGKSEHGMLWLGQEPRTDVEVMVAMQAK